MGEMHLKRILPPLDCCQTITLSIDEANSPSFPSPSSSTPPLPDTFSTIRRNCERHLRRLERYRKARSFCSLTEMENGNEGGGAEAENGMAKCTKNSSEKQFADLREKMLRLVENDMALLAKLLSLGDTLRELRQRQAMAENQQQQGKIELDEEEEREKEDEFHPIEELKKKKQPMMVYGRQRRQRNPIPPEFGAPQEVTHLFVRERDKEEEDEEEEEEIMRPNVQYFSRKNSVLRIPIPPRASNRAFARCKKDVVEKERRRKMPSPPNQQHQPPSISIDLDSGHSSDSEHQSPPPPPPIADVASSNPSNSRFSTLSSGLSTQSSISCLSNGQIEVPPTKEQK